MCFYFPANAQMASLLLFQLNMWFFIFRDDVSKSRANPTWISNFANFLRSPDYFSDDVFRQSWSFPFSSVLLSFFFAFFFLFLVIMLNITKPDCKMRLWIQSAADMATATIRSKRHWWRFSAVIKPCIIIYHLGQKAFFLTHIFAITHKTRLGAGLVT